MGKQLIKRALTALGFIYKNKIRSGIYLLRDRISSGKEKSRDSQFSFAASSFNQDFFRRENHFHCFSKNSKLYVLNFMAEEISSEIVTSSNSLEKKKDYSISCRLKSKNGMYVVVYKAFDLKNLLLRDDTLPRRPKIVPIIGE